MLYFASKGLRYTLQSATNTLLCYTLPLAGLWPAGRVRSHQPVQLRLHHYSSIRLCNQHKLPLYSPELQRMFYKLLHYRLAEQYSGMPAQTGLPGSALLFGISSRPVPADRLLQQLPDQLLPVQQRSQHPGVHRSVRELLPASFRMPAGSEVYYLRNPVRRIASLPAELRFLRCRRFQVRLQESVLPIRTIQGMYR